MEGVIVLGLLLFVMIIIVSCGFEFYELYQVRRDLEEGSRSGNHILFPRHHYAELHRRNYYTPPLPGGAERTFRVKRKEQPVRCEVCHQDDCFEVRTGYCTRCNYYTL
ncbi:hypothetical protein [Chloracidobacterium thermophilum]|uniref:Uncharacterized protein n=1 Tax=Chloracidobacterium thermophilum (strain B) TaxID=981222 RepID=G2LGE8_CHLTF|nr:hypothetical protein [Chloracidobacterium thermophilum]AEP10908.1 hypothetical protein Cabther_A0133 [Chloracidobacterium thermophilum B]QUV78836.1 hypothetical protein J8C08_00675 [Chloracidobacterium thermophilum]